MARKRTKSVPEPTYEPAAESADSVTTPATSTTTTSKTTGASSGLTKRRSKRFTIITIVSLAVLAAAIGGYVVFSSPGDDTTDGTGINVQTNTNVARKIDGISVPAVSSNLPTVAVMVENLVAARPQSGLDQAQLVYEALAEGGITRFLAVFADDQPIAEIGPVRSARPYYLDWAKELDAIYMHVGGSPTALAKIKSINLRDVDQFFNSAYFWRSKTRSAPHNLYTSSELISFLLRDKFPDLTPNYTSWKYEPGQAGSATQNIRIDFSSFSYQVEWRYDTATNTYKRYQAGQPHTMVSGAQIAASNVVVQFVTTALEDAQRLSMETVGSGPAQIFHNGQAITGTWSKSAIDNRTIFQDAGGQEVKLTPGTTWVEIVPTDRTITVT